MKKNLIILIAGILAAGNISGNPAGRRIRAREGKTWPLHSSSPDVTRERVRQIYAKALRKCRHMLNTADKQGTLPPDIKPLLDSLRKEESRRLSARAAFFREHGFQSQENDSEE